MQNCNLKVGIWEPYVMLIKQKSRGLFHKPRFWKLIEKLLIKKTHESKMFCYLEHDILERGWEVTKMAKNSFCLSHLIVVINCVCC